MSVPSRLAKAARLLRDGGPRAAAKLLRRLVHQEPTLAAAQELLSEAYLATDHPGEAVGAAILAIAMDPKVSEARRHLALGYQRIGQTDLALEALDEAIATHPEQVGFYLDSAVLLRQTEGLDSALERLELARAACPEEGWRVDRLHLHLLLLERRYDELRRLATDHLLEDPDDISALEFLAAAAYHLGDMPAATDAMRRLVAQAPRVHEYALRLAELLRDSGDVMYAAEVLEHLAHSAEDEEVRTDASSAIEAMDEAQLPVVLLLAGDSRRFRRELEADPAEATLRRGFAISRAGLAALMARLSEFEGPAGSDIAFH